MICIGKIDGAFGVSGLVKITSFCQPKRSIKSYKPIYIDGSTNPIRVEFTTKKNNSFNARVNNIFDMEKAKQLSGKYLYVKRETLPNLNKDEFYHSDLICCNVLNEEFEMIGPITGVENHGASDIIEFLNEKTNKKILIPLTKQFVKKIAVEKKYIVIINDIIKQ